MQFRILSMRYRISLPSHRQSNCNPSQCPEIASFPLQHRTAKSVLAYLLLAFAALVPLTAGCTTVPITGRSQLNMISDSLLRETSDREFSNFMSAVNQKSAVLLASESAQAAEILASVNRASARIVDAAGLRQLYNWETVVVKSNAANAMVMPNGKIVVFTGLLSVAKTEGGLAAVLGHEVAHVVARHQAERVSQVLLTQLTFAAADIALAASHSRYRPAIGAALGLGAQFGVLLPFSRTHESEADHIGLLLMAKAGYDPAEASGFWQRMQATGRSGPWEILSTHPSHSTRVAQIQEWLPEATVLYADPARPLPANLADLRAAAAERSQRIALAPVAPLPSLQPGFWFQYSSPDRAAPVTQRLVRQEVRGSDQCIVFESDTGEVGVYTLDLGLLETTRADGTWTRFTPPLRSYKWPLTVGDSWTDSIIIEESSGKRQTVEMRAAIVSYESTTVSAGSFMAYKIMTTLGGRRYRQAWYAPETHTLVKIVSYDSQGREAVRQLVGYQKTNEPVSVLTPRSPDLTVPHPPSRAEGPPSISAMEGQRSAGDSARRAAAPTSPPSDTPPVSATRSTDAPRTSDPPSSPAGAAKGGLEAKAAPSNPRTGGRQYWIIGSWEAEEDQSGLVEGIAKFRFWHDGVQLRWRMARAGWLSGVYTRQVASGTVSKISDSEVELYGKYEITNVVGVGQPVRHTLTRDGDRLRGYELTSDGIQQLPWLLRRTQ